MGAAAARAYKEYFSESDWQSRACQSAHYLDIFHDEDEAALGYIDTSVTLLGTPILSSKGFESNTIKVYELRRRQRANQREGGEELQTTVGKIFEENLEKWKEETKVISSVHAIIMNKAYQRIIGLGPEVLPLIFREYNKSGGLWHPALEAITGVNPIPEECVGRLKLIKEKWLEWANEHGYL